MTLTPVAQYPIISQEHISINGGVYWLISSGIDGFTYSILGIDREEKLIKISLPSEVIAKALFFVDFEGCLSLVSLRDDFNRFDLWVLEDDNESVWVKKMQRYHT